MMHNVQRAWKEETELAQHKEHCNSSSEIPVTRLLEARGWTTKDTSGVGQTTERGGLFEDGERRRESDQLDADVVVGVGADDVDQDSVTLGGRDAERQRVVTSVDPLAVTICHRHDAAALSTERVRYAV